MGFTHRRGVASVVIMVASLALAGCTNESPHPASSVTPKRTPATPSTSATSPLADASPSVSIPTTLTEKQRAAADKAIQVYIKFEEINDLVAANGGENPEAYEPVATSIALENARRFASLYREKGWRNQGNTRIGYIVVKSVSLNTDSSTRTVPEVHLRTCTDSSNIDVIDESGAYVVRSPKPRFYAGDYFVRKYVDTEGLDGADHWFVAKSKNSEVDSCAQS